MRWLLDGCTYDIADAGPRVLAPLFDAFREQVDAAWLFTSATLSVRGDFRHFTDRMGLQDAATLQLDSPFDYVNNARLWLPESLPEPRDPGFVPALLDDVVPLLEASRGRAFPGAGRRPEHHVGVLGRRTHR